MFGRLCESPFDAFVVFDKDVTGGHTNAASRHKN